MKVALIQQHATTNVEDNIERAVVHFQKAAGEGAEVIAFAELAFLPFLPQRPVSPGDIDKAETIPGRTTKIFSDLSKESGVVTILNLFERCGDKTYDASPVIDADGRILGTTRMVHVMDGQGFFEKGFYTPGDRSDNVFQTQKGRIGVAICYDRHFPEYMRSLALLGAELVVVPQAGAMDEWPPGIFEGELRIASFQNGYFSALVNRVGQEEFLHFSGESFVVDPFGKLLGQAARDRDDILVIDCDFDLIEKCAAKRFFLADRRPDFYNSFRLADDQAQDSKT
jgi:N-carbamoylputrescine amidase